MVTFSPNLQKLICMGRYQHQSNRCTFTIIKYLDPKDSSMWWAGKELLREKQLNHYTGKN